MISVDQALAIVLASTDARLPQRIALADALGAQLAEDVVSDVDSPPHDKALMDGYAVRSGDPQPVRRVVDEVMAGDVPHRPVGAGEATRIMTGAPIPDGADCVVPVEQTELQPDAGVLLAQAPAAGQNVMRRGESVRAGQTVVSAGQRLGPAEIGVLAEFGAANPVCRFVRPRVAVLATGDELVDPTSVLGAGQIRNSNGPMLLAAARAVGASAIDLGVARDDHNALEASIRRGLAADVLLVCGGVSAGDRDLAPGVLAGLGVEERFHKVNLKPGKPLWFGIGRSGDHTTAVFGLPGNPVSGLVCFCVFVAPLLAQLVGDERGLAMNEAAMAHDHDHPAGRETFRPAVIEQGRATIVPWRGSADLASLVGATHLVRLPSTGCGLRAGQAVQVVSLC
ncbi:Molybdopterin molybdenumtransferase [Pirellulimonas nuda]|uniref:Molybdopterin molybdenumtransferase n=1 Tax=Pirellulimonas nuda TaxID=2528009 RepID=A0A518DHY1_9BACT|nr:gephyrin-like molybdotransferase Glp [Pirellulimonas nuda]QDU91087.1 Molybdopterin molybdenumtransferase [Pirellulimonas nuda]